MSFNFQYPMLKEKKNYMWNISEFEENSYARIPKMNKFIKHCSRFTIRNMEDSDVLARS